MIDRITAMCEPFLRELARCGGSGLLCRGEHTRSILELRGCPVGRKPRDTHEDFHRAADDWFLQRFGTRYRSNSLFCTSSERTAAYYGDGNVRYIYPVGAFKVCWSPQVRDLFTWTSDRDIPGFLDFLENESEYREGSLCRALAGDCEIMVHCATFFSLSAPLDRLRVSGGDDVAPGLCRH